MGSATTNPTIQTTNPTVQTNKPVVQSKAKDPPNPAPTTTPKTLPATNPAIQTKTGCPILIALFAIRVGSATTAYHAECPSCHSTGASLANEESM